MLAGKVVIVPIGIEGAAVARRMAAGGATVVLLAGEAEADEVGRLAADIERAPGGGRPAVFVAAGDDLDPLVDYVEELFRT